MQYTIVIYVKLMIILVIGSLSLVTWVGLNDYFTHVGWVSSDFSSL
jgi:hypothetical protein